MKKISIEDRIASLKVARAAAKHTASSLASQDMAEDEKYLCILDEIREQKQPRDSEEVLVALRSNREAKYLSVSNANIDALEERWLAE